MADMITSRDISTDSHELVNGPNGTEQDTGYSRNLGVIRHDDYPMLKATTYLDHAGTTLYPKSMIESYTADLTKNLYGNPHSASASSQLSSRRIDDVRLQVLRFVGADPNDFDIIFTANATAAIKLVGDALRDHSHGFWLGYHCDSHTSLIGLREIATQGSYCFRDDNMAQKWIDDCGRPKNFNTKLCLFAYPGQSNMTGRRLPRAWCGQIRDAAAKSVSRIYTLLDAAALASTSPLHLTSVDDAPDFTALSFYKIFGFPDLGALIVRKASGDVLRRRRYFAGGTVDATSVCTDSPWHMKKETLHSALEDGTLPFHNIIALEHALKTHGRLYGSMQHVSDHTAALCNELHRRMAALKHANTKPVCRIYERDLSRSSEYGPVIAFHILDNTGKCVSNSEVEKLGSVQDIQFRTGGLCNPGGIANHLSLTSEELKGNYAAGLRCGGDNDIMNGKATGVIRVSFGAMSDRSDIDKFMDFLQTFYVCRVITTQPTVSLSPVVKTQFYIESMSIFPIKSCSAFKIPANHRWNVTANGLAWDREWCLVHQGTNAALSQKQFPKMTLIKPVIDVECQLMTISFDDGIGDKTISIGLNDVPSATAKIQTCGRFKPNDSTVCGDRVPVHLYMSSEINEFFSEALGVQCALARYFANDTNLRMARMRKPKSNLPTSEIGSVPLPSIKLSNESPILLVSRSSVNRLNEQIRSHRAQPQEILPESFRANIVVSEQSSKKGSESPYAEDSWTGLSVPSGNSIATFDILGPCQRCQMVCIDQSSAKRRQEPFSTLAKTRRWDGGVWFGVHMCLSDTNPEIQATLKVGDLVSPV